MVNDNFLSDSTQRAIMNGDFEEAGQYLVRDTMSEFQYHESGMHLNFVNYLANYGTNISQQHHH